MNTMKKTSEFCVNLQQMVVAIENSVSLVGMNDTNHGKRVGYIALQIANHLGFSEEEKSFIFELGLLHDCGVSSDTVHTNLVNQFDWEDAHKHSDIGYNLLKEFEPLAQLAIPVRYHHTHWDKLKNINIPLNEKRLANLIFIADRVDVSASSFYGRDILLHADNIRETIQKKSGTFFDPELVEGFFAASLPEAFWISLEDRHITRFTWDMGNCGYEKKLKLDDLKQLAKIFSYLVDQKSSFTAQHSFRVAQLARHLAGRCELTAHDIDKIEVAGYLHDIGKLHVPDSILNKPGSLTAPERSIINQHSYETYEILRTINGLEEIAKWAAYHHENSLGTGYPFHPSVLEFSVPARIIAVSDVFQALVQDRPYRKGMKIKEVFKILYEMVKEGKLDETIVQTVTEDAEQCYNVAKGES
jgi:putative nucleotidyltransferase with HDIG domain